MAEVEADNIDVFNATTAAIFDFLLSNFPIFMDIHPGVLGEALSPYLVTATENSDGVLKKQMGETYILNSNATPREYVPEVVAWLRVEGFLHRNEKDGGYQLSSTALSILNSTPKGLTQPLRRRLSTVVKGGATEAGRAAIGEVVGHIVGAAARSFAGA